MWGNQVNGHFGLLQHCMRITFIPSVLAPSQNNIFPYRPGNVDTILYRDDNVATSIVTNNQYTKIPNAQAMWIHPYIETKMWIHQHTKIPNIQAMWIHPYIEMHPHSEDIQ